jgi:hypothetical protein
VAEKQWLYLSLRIFQDNLHIFTSAPRILVLPDEVSGWTGCDTSICSPNLEKREDISITTKPALSYAAVSSTRRLQRLYMSENSAPVSVTLLTTHVARSMNFWRPQLRHLINKLADAQGPEVKLT